MGAAGYIGILDWKLVPLVKLSFKVSGDPRSYLSAGVAVVAAYFHHETAVLSGWYSYVYFTFFHMD